MKIRGLFKKAAATLMAAVTALSNFACNDGVCSG